METLDEETFDGFKIIYCPHCKRKGKAFFKKNEKTTYCPACFLKIDANNIEKTVEKEVEGYRNITQ